MYANTRNSNYNNNTINYNNVSQIKCLYVIVSLFARRKSSNNKYFNSVYLWVCVCVCLFWSIFSLRIEWQFIDAFDCIYKYSLFFISFYSGICNIFCKCPVRLDVCVLSAINALYLCVCVCVSGDSCVFFSQLQFCVISPLSLALSVNSLFLIFNTIRLFGINSIPSSISLSLLCCLFFYFILKFPLLYEWVRSLIFLLPVLRLRRALSLLAAPLHR